MHQFSAVNEKPIYWGNMEPDLEETKRNATDLAKKARSQEIQANVPEDRLAFPKP